MLVVRIIFATLVGLLPASVAAEKCVPLHEPIALRLGGFDARGEIERPGAGMPIRGLAVMFAGSDVADLNGTIVDTQDRVVSQPMRQIADRLACAGIASIRYNKRFVTGPASVDRPRFDRLNGSDLAADGRTALAFARSREDLAAAPLILIGWSEGTTVAMALAHDQPPPRAIVLIAPVITSMAATVQAQYLRVGKPYLERYATAAGLDAAAVARADAGPGGVLAHVFVRMFRGFKPGEQLNPLLDRNQDGRITFAEADPIIAGWYADGPDGGLGMAATGRALPGLATSIVDTTMPILVLQGSNDAMVDPKIVGDFASRTPPKRRLTLWRYERLGHSLGRADTALNDALLPIEPKPLNDMVGWLQKILPR